MNFQKNRRERDTLSNSRKKKLALNTIISLALQVVTVICGFILPRLILESFGSDVNGLVNSISQFLGIITLLDFGVGAVVQSALYKPLSDNDIDMISKIYVSANKFFKRLAKILIVYVIMLMIFYPLLVNKNFGYMYTALLIAAICISSFAQYYFGIVNSLLLNADQRGYIQYTAQIITLILNTVASYIVIKVGASIQVVKFTTSLIFLIRPFFLVLYVRKHYSINNKITYTEEPIKQKWNGIAQHFASFVLSGTDNIVLTIFSTLSNVSIYSVYNIVITGVKNILLSMTTGFQSLIGEMIAKKEDEQLKSFFGYVEWFLHTSTTLIFGCTGILILDFVRVYTYGINDADYIQPLFAVLITLANAGHSLRLPYNILILAAGHYKQTQSTYIIAMIINIVVSIFTVNSFGLIGVAIGTLCAMMYQTVWMALYDSRNFIHRSMRYFWIQLFIDIITVMFMWIGTRWIKLINISYLSWFISVFEVGIVSIVIVFIVNFIFKKNYVISIINKILKRRGKI